MKLHKNTPNGMHIIRVFLPIFLWGTLGVQLNAQQVSNVRPEKNGEKITVYYQIDNATSKQFFEVSISASTPDGKTIHIKSVTGDVGKNIQGGRNQYMAEWDVLKDIANLGSADISVKAVLIKDLSLVEEPRPKSYSPFRYDKFRRVEFFVAAQMWGVKTGFKGRIGFALSAGMVNDGFTLLADFSKSIILRKNFRWNVYPLCGMHMVKGTEQVFMGYDINEYGNLVPIYSYEEFEEPFFAYGFGTDITIGHIYLNFDAFYDSHSIGYLYGIGWRF